MFFSMIMSIWGVFFLGLLGIFFYVEAVNLFPDLPFEASVDGMAVPLTTASVIFPKLFTFAPKVFF